MKRIINGKMYDTETAKVILYSEHGLPEAGDYYGMALYRKGNGEFFLAEVGGMTERARLVGEENCLDADEGIIPFSQDETKEWLEDWELTDVYCSLFGVPEE